MAQLGNQGQMKLGSNAIAELRDIGFDQEVDLVEDTVMGNADKTFQATQKGWTANANAFWDEGDTNGQMACTPGSSVTLNIYPEGSASTDTYYTGTAIVKSNSLKQTHNGLVEFAMTFQGTGALTKTTV